MTETPNNLRDIMAKPPAPSEADKWFRHRIRLVPYLVAVRHFRFLRPGHGAGMTDRRPSGFRLDRQPPPTGHYAPETEAYHHRQNVYFRVQAWFALVVLIVLGVAFCTPASADPYDNQLTMAEWRVAPLASRMAASRAIVDAAQREMYPQSPDYMQIVYAIQLRMCVDKAAKETALGPTDIAFVALTCIEKFWIK